MKSLALENYGVQEMSYQEQNETDGGVFGWDDLLIGLAVGIGVASYTQIVNDWDNFKAGLNGKCESKDKK